MMIAVMSVILRNCVKKPEKVRTSTGIFLNFFYFQLTFNCKWLSPEVTADLSCSFHRPFTVRHVLHSSEIRLVLAL